MRSTRVACLHIPLFPLAARLRAEPELLGGPLVIVQGNGSHAHVAAASRAARRAGIQPGHSLLAARALLPEILFRNRDPALERAAQNAALEAAQSFSPRVEDAGEGIVYLDVHGLSRRFPREEELAHALSRAGTRVGLTAWVAIGAGKLVARIAVGPELTVVAPGEEARFLATQSLSRLLATFREGTTSLPKARVAFAPADLEELSSTLSRWGLVTIGDLAKLSLREVSKRLGSLGEALHRAARGRDGTPLVPLSPPVEFTEGQRLEWALGELEPFLFLARAALERLEKRLAAQGLSCVRLSFDLELDPDGHDVRSMSLPAPTRDVKTLLTLVRLDLEKKPPGAPVTGFSFTAHAEPPRKPQLSLFGPPSLSPDKLMAALARLAGLLGPHRMGSPRSVDSHEPGRFELAPFEALEPKEPMPKEGQAIPAARPFSVRTLRPPLPLEVLVENGRPVSVSPLHTEAGTAPVSIRGRLRFASGPWRLEEGWWTEAPLDRDYWDVELAKGGVCRVFRDARNGEWFADGLYD